MPIKALLVYANTPNEPLMPLGIASLATALEDSGHEVALFDTTFYPDPSSDSQEHRAKSSQIKSADYASVGITPIKTDMMQDFREFVARHSPDLIAVSCVEITYMLALNLLRQVQDSNIPVIMGGPFATFSPEFVLESGLVDMVCVGEGESAIKELAARLEQGKPTRGIPNIWHRDKETIIPPDTHNLLDVKEFPVPRFDVFDPKRIYRSMNGVIYRMLPVEISRGCPYMCTYCSAPAYRSTFSTQGEWLRFKSVEQIIREVAYYVDKYEVEYFYFVSETFLAMPKKERQKFYALYDEFKIPFWFNTRPETVTVEDVKALKRVGCDRLSIGIESGNEHFRRTMLRRNYSNETILKAVRAIQEAGIQFSVNNMVGFPEETRKMFFDTIEINRQFKADAHSLSVFQPFRGTALHEYCVEKGYYDPDTFSHISFSDPVLDMPTMARDTIKGLHRTFNLYRVFEKSRWDDIRKAEALTPEGDGMFNRLLQEAYEENLI